MSMDCYIILKHRDLSVIGLRGNLNASMSETRELIARTSALETAPSKRETGRDFLALFDTTQPILDITLVRLDDGDASFVGYSLSEVKLQSKIEEIAAAISFSPKKSDADFERTLRTEFVLEQRSYEVCAISTEFTRASFDNTFATARYANFLTRYKTMPIQNAQKQAFQRFGLEIRI